MPADLAKDLGDDAALAAVDRFAEASFSRITNKSGFLMVRSQSTLHEQCRQRGRICLPGSVFAACQDKDCAEVLAGYHSKSPRGWPR